MIKSRIAAPALLVAVMLVISACGPTGQSASPTGAASQPATGSAPPDGSGPPASAPTLEASGTLNVMGFGCVEEGDDIAHNRVAEFEAKYSEVELDCIEGNLDEQVFLTAVQSGNPPDLIYMDRNKIGSFASQGAIQPIDSCVADAAIDMANFRPAAVNQVTFDGQIYGIPEFFNVVVVVINNTVAEDAGVDVADIDMGNWEALRTASQAMIEKDGNNITRIGFDPKLPEFLPLWARINGVEILSADGKTSNLDDPKVAEALTVARDLLLDHGTAPEFFAARDAMSADFFGAENPIATNVLGAFPIEVFFLNVMAGNSPDVDITVTAPKGVDGNEVTYATGNTWAIPEGADNIDAACAMAATMTHHDSWIVAAEKRKAQRDADGVPYTGTYTGNISADEQIFGEIVDLSDMPAFADAVDVAIGSSENAFSIPPSAASVAFEEAWRNAVNRVLNEGADPAEALTQADQEAQAELDAGG